MSEGAMSPSSRIDERRKQFVTEIVALKVDIGEAGKGPNDIVRSGKTAEVRLEAPDAQNHRVVDAIEILWPWRARGLLSALCRGRVQCGQATRRCVT